MPKIINPLPSSDEIRAAFDYDLQTGVLSWKVRPVVPGDERACNIFNSLFPGKPTGCPNGLGYLRILWRRKHYVAHRLAWKHYYGTEATLEIDHINGNRSDNRIANLREATPSQNMANARFRPMNKNGFRGVRHRPDGTYQASIRKNGVGLHLGSFKTLEQAAAAYQKAAKLIHGEFKPQD